MPYNGAGVSPAKGRKPEKTRLPNRLYLQHSAVTFTPALDFEPSEGNGMSGGGCQWGATGNSDRSVPVPNLVVPVGTKKADGSFKHIDFNSGTMTFGVTLDASFNVDNPRTLFETNDCSILLRDLPSGARKWEVRWRGQYLESVADDSNIFIVILRWHNGTFDGTNRLKFGAFPDPNRHFTSTDCDWSDRIFPGLLLEPRPWVLGGDSAFIAFQTDPTDFYIGSSALGANGANAIINDFAILLWPMYDGVHGTKTYNIARDSVTHPTDDEVRELLLGNDTTYYRDFKVGNCVDATTNFGLGFTLWRDTYDLRVSSPGANTTLGVSQPASLGDEASMYLAASALSNWTKVGSPGNLTALSENSKRCGGGAYFTSTAGNQGVDYSIAVTAGDSWALGFIVGAIPGGGVSKPRVEIYDQTGAAIVNWWEGKDNVEAPDEPQFGFITGTAPAGCTDMRIRVMNTGTGGSIAIHGIYGPYTNLLPNTHWPANAQDPYRPDTTWGYGNSTPGSLSSIRDTNPPYYNSGGVSLKCGYDAYTNYLQIRKLLTVAHVSKYMTGHWSRLAYFLSVDLSSNDCYEGEWLYYMNWGPTYDNGVLTGLDWAYHHRLLRSDNTTVEYWLGKNSYNWATEDAWFDDPYLVELADVTITVDVPTSTEHETERGGVIVHPGSTMTMPVSNFTAAGGELEFVWVPSFGPWEYRQHLTWSNQVIVKIWGNSSNYLTMYPGNTTHKLNQFYIQSRTGGAATQSQLISIGSNQDFVYKPGERIRVLIKMGAGGRVRVYFNNTLVFDKPFTTMTLVPTLVYFGKSESASAVFSTPAEYIETSAPTGSPIYPSPITPTLEVSNAALTSAFEATTGKLPTSEFSVYDVIERGAGVALLASNSPGNENGASFHEFASGVVTNSYKLLEQGAHDMSIDPSGNIIIAGTDPTESWALGNVYRLPNGSSTVTKVRTLPNVLHTLGVTNNVGGTEIWVATGAHAGDSKTWQGRVFRSVDNGATWDLNELVTSYRVYDLLFHQASAGLFAIGTSYGLQTQLYKRGGLSSWSVVSGVYPDIKSRLVYEGTTGKLIVMKSDRKSVYLIDNLDAVTTLNLPYRAIASWHPMTVGADTILYVATEDGNVWKCADLSSPTWELHTQMSEIANIFCTPGDATLYMSTKGAGAQLYRA